MVEESDGVGEAFDDSLRVALTIAAQFAERVARLREQTARQREAAATQEARELQSRFDAERHAVRAALLPVQSTEWWNNATVEDIASVHETAQVWRKYDDVAEAAAETIRREVQDRYGVDIDDLQADPGQLAARLNAFTTPDQDRETTEEHRRREAEELTLANILLAAEGRAERDEETETSMDTETHEVSVDADLDRLLDASQAEDRPPLNNAAAGAGLEYDSPERRQQFAQSLRGIDNKEAVDAVVLADGENAKHPREAVTSTPGRTSDRHPTTTVGAARERSRKGLAR